jgi:hypothetical protein
VTPSPLSRNLWPAEDAGHRRIPFEYAFEFALTGRPVAVKQTVAVSVEGGFTATSIGYGFVADAVGVEFGPISTGVIFKAIAPTTLGEILLGDILNGAHKALSEFADFSPGRPAGDTAARIGIQLNPDVADFALQGNGLSDRVLSRLFRVAGNGTGEVLFRYAIFDEGTGRAFQSEPILNIAGLGTSNGERPFRHFSPPILFEPLSTIGVEITPVSNHVGRLFIALQGYKVLGGEGTPTGALTQMRRRHGRRR